MDPVEESRREIGDNQAPNIPLQTTQDTSSTVVPPEQPVAPAPMSDPIIPQPNSSPTMPPPAPSSDMEEEHENGFPRIIAFILGAAVVLIIAIVLLLLLIPKFQSSSGKVTLQWWGLWEDPAIMQPIITSFEKENPNITIQYTKEDPKQYTDRLVTRIQNGNGPDIFRFHNSWVPMLSQVLVPLPRSVISPQDFTNLYYPIVQKDLVNNGAIYGIPLDIDTLALYTNDSLFQKAGVAIPSTWTDFINTARALTVKDPNSGKIVTSGASLGTYDNVSHAPDIIAMLFAQNGVDIHNFNASMSNASDALTFYTSFARDTGNVWDATLEPSMTSFAKGNVAMYFGYSWDIFTIKALNPTLQFTISAVPHLPGREITIGSYWVEGVSNKSKHQKEAMIFMQYLAKQSTLQQLYTEETKTRPFGELYPMTILAKSLSSNHLISPFVSQAKTAVSSPFVADTGDTVGINSQMNGYLGNAIRAILGNTSAQSAAQTLSQGVTQVLQQYAAQQPH